MGKLRAVAPFVTRTRQIAAGDIVDTSDPVVADHSQFFEPVDLTKKARKPATDNGAD